jgi:hypothetical protein
MVLTHAIMHKSQVQAELLLESSDFYAAACRDFLIMNGCYVGSQDDDRM